MKRNEQLVGYLKENNNLTYNIKVKYRNRFIIICGEEE